MATRKKSSAVIGRLLGLALEVPPAAYVVITGEAPGWVRVWLATWLSIWLLSNVITSATAMADK